MSRTATVRLLAIVAGVALAALLVIGLIELLGSSSSSSSPSAEAGSDSSPLSVAQIQGRLAGSPAALAALHAQASEILPGGADALHARLAALRGYPLVINKWASWCVPCRSERAAFQRASVTLGRTVAFVGIDSADTSRSDGRAFLRAYPEGYPSYYDKSGQLGTDVTDSSFTPVTVFYDRAGHEYIHQGPYPSAAKLERDIQRYALDA